MIYPLKIHLNDYYFHQEDKFILTRRFCGIESAGSDLHSLKALEAIEVTDGGISICSNDEHLPKAPTPIDVTDGGIVICFNEEHPMNV